jgi:3-keto-disaccharide hydrolase
MHPLIFRRMKINLFLALTATALLAPFQSVQAADSEEGFVQLFDGKTFNGWKKAEEHPDTWKIEDSALVAHGDRCHLFYVGDDKPFKNFHLKVDVMTGPHSNGGIYFHTKYQASDWPRAGFECQVNNTHSDWKKTASLYDIVNIAQTPAQDNKWWTQEIIVKGSSVTVMIDGKIIFVYNEPPGTQPGKQFARKLDEGTFALQGHDPNSTIHYKNIRVKRLD